ncbi:RHS repeat-associated core domain-containing protein [Vibrio metschnikovii]|uniref:RHS repeat domain-containing protein n=1 Tax=Vibrio metschnikovii TaxID=28172 RepID=UPI002FC5E391
MHQTIEYLYEPESFRPLAQVTHKANQASQLHYIVTDHAGTPQELCSENGEVVWQGEQALWGHYQQQHLLPYRGSREEAINDALYCDLRYQGQIEDRESGLYYNVNRYYDADSGQYLSPDPIGFAGGLRPQAYVHNPLEWVDPLGLVGCSLPNGQRVADFERSLVKLPANERVAAVKGMSEQVAESHNWQRTKRIEKLNPGRTVYTDGKSYYSVDTQHGRFEQIGMKKGNHLGEIDMGLNKIPNSLDKSGGHDLRVK